jgi:hypothetical protein
LDPALLKAARTEYGLNALNQVLHIVSEKNLEGQVHFRHLHQLVIDDYGTYGDELAILIAQRGKDWTTSILMLTGSCKIV